LPGRGKQKEVGGVKERVWAEYDWSLFYAYLKLAEETARKCKKGCMYVDKKE
jgi:hypothetical protein